jgi:hypothetical protein
MLGIWNAYTNIFLIVAGVAMLIAFGLPMLLVPMSWARLFRWEVPQSQKLASFLGRSMGIFICIMAIFAFKATQNTVTQPFFFDLMLWIFGAMIILHVYGAIRKVQPITETVEILVWVILTLVTLGFYPA